MEIPTLKPITERPALLSDLDALREIHQARVIELEDALRGMIGLVDLIHYSKRLASDPRLNHRYIDAVKALRWGQSAQP